MNSLPAEVLYSISQLLSQRDKLECTTVCQQWRKVMNHSLFRVISVYSQEQLDKLIQRVQKERILGTKVERIMLTLTFNEDFDHTILFDLFPNVRQFKLMNQKKLDPRNHAMELPEVDEYEGTYETHPWCKSIEEMVENLPYNNTRTLLYSGLCSNLTYLKLIGKKYHAGDAYDFVDILENAPALRTLELHRFIFSYDEYEYLHVVLPSLKSILLTACLIDFRLLPATIEPATSITSFQCIKSESDMYIDSNNYIKYISQKYPNVEELAFESRVFESDDPDDVEPAAEHRAVVTSYLKKLGRQLKTLKITVKTFDEDFTPGFDFDILDECGCQIENLVLYQDIYIPMLERLSRTDQVKHIKSLVVNRMAYIFTDPVTTVSLKWLAQFKALKELTLHFPYTIRPRKVHQLNLPDLLDALAETQVDTLRVRDTAMDFDTSGVPRSYPSIKNLTIGSTDIRFNTDSIISQSLPNLKRLTLDKCWEYKRSFVFPMSKLSYLQVSNVYSKGPLHVLLITLDDGQQRLYTTNNTPTFFRPDMDNLGSDPFSFPCISSTPCGNSNDIPRLTVVCKSVSNFFMVRTDF